MGGLGGVNYIYPSRHGFEKNKKRVILRGLYAKQKL
jgi:hypothetical protein